MHQQPLSDSPESALDGIILADFALKMARDGRLLHRKALDLVEHLTAEEQSFFKRQHSTLFLGHAETSALDDSMTAFAALWVLLDLMKRGTPLPTDLVRAFSESSWSKDTARYFAHSRIPSLIWCCRTWPRTYLAAIARAAVAVSNPLSAHGPEVSDLDLVRMLLHAKDAIAEDAVVLRRETAISQLDEHQAATLVSMCIDCQRQNRLQSEYLFARLPNWMAALCPSVLATQHTRLLDAKFPCMSEVYRVLTTATRDRLIREFLHGALSCGDAAVRQALLNDQDWKHYGNELTASYGWAMLPDGRRRDLITEQCFLLRDKANPGVPVDIGAVRVVTDHEQACPACSRKLITLFDFDLTNPKLAFLALGEDGKPADPAPRRLRIAACEQCCAFGSDPEAAIFTNVDLQGRSTVRKRLFGGPKKVPPDPDVFDWPRDSHAIESAPCSPVAVCCEASPGKNEAVGGLPKWEQDPAFPTCPKCKRLMPFVGQVSPGSSQMVYAFLCRKCWIATALSQLD